MRTSRIQGGDPDPALALEDEPLAGSGSLSSNTDLLDFLHFYTKFFFGYA